MSAAAGGGRLEDYVQHKPDCELTRCPQGIYIPVLGERFLSPSNCTCGLAALLASGERPKDYRAVCIKFHNALVGASRAGMFNAGLAEQADNEYLALEATGDREPPKELESALAEFGAKLAASQKDLPPECTKVLHDNYWDLLTPEAAAGRPAPVSPALREEIEQLPLICEKARQTSPERTTPCDAICMRQRILALLNAGVRSGKETDMDMEVPKDPYKTASEWAIEHTRIELGSQPDPTLGVRMLMRATYWSAWRGSRNTAAAMLNKAAELKLTPEQFQALTEVAEQWAWD